METIVTNLKDPRNYAMLAHKPNLSLDALREKLIKFSSEYSHHLAQDSNRNNNRGQPSVSNCNERVA